MGEVSQPRFVGNDPFRGGETAGDFGGFRLNIQTLNRNVTIPADRNAVVAGPLTVPSNLTLTVNGNLTIV